MMVLFHDDYNSEEHHNEGIEGIAVKLGNSHIPVRVISGRMGSEAFQVKETRSIVLIYQRQVYNGDVKTDRIVEIRRSLEEDGIIQKEDDKNVSSKKETLLLDMLDALPSESRDRVYETVIRLVAHELSPDKVANLDTSPSPTEILDVAMVDTAFKSVINSDQYDGKRGRKPLKFRRIREAFRGRENDAITLDELAAYFAPHSQNPRQAAANAVSVLNKNFKTNGIDIEVQSISSNIQADTIYRLRRTSA